LITPVSTISAISVGRYISENDCKKTKTITTIIDRV